MVATKRDAVVAVACVAVLWATAVIIQWFLQSFGWGFIRTHLTNATKRK